MILRWSRRAAIQLFGAADYLEGERPGTGERISRCFRVLILDVIPAEKAGTVEDSRDLDGIMTISVDNPIYANDHLAHRGIA